MGVQYKGWKSGYEDALVYNLDEYRLVLKFSPGLSHYNVDSKALISFRSLRVCSDDKSVTFAELDVSDLSEVLSAPDVIFHQNTAGSDAAAYYQHDLPAGKAVIVQKGLVAIYDYEIPVPKDPFSFRLEIHKRSELFTGSIYRLERFRPRPAFHQHDREDTNPLINGALIYIRDECIDERKLRDESPETVIAIFSRELQNIFDQLIEY